MNISDTSRTAQRGVTLIELMVVVVVIAILASIAIPSYSQYVVKARRQVAAQELLTIASRQEQFFADNKTYAVSVIDLGYAADPIGTDENGELVDVGDPNCHVQLLGFLDNRLPVRPYPGLYAHCGATGKAGCR